MPQGGSLSFLSFSSPFWELLPVSDEILVSVVVDECVQVDPDRVRQERRLRINSGALHPVYLASDFVRADVELLGDVGYCSIHESPPLCRRCFVVGFEQILERAREQSEQLSDFAGCELAILLFAFISDARNAENFRDIGVSQSLSCLFCI